MRSYTTKYIIDFGKRYQRAFQEDGIGFMSFVLPVVIAAGVAKGLAPHVKKAIKKSKKKKK